MHDIIPLIHDLKIQLPDQLLTFSEIYKENIKV